MVTLSKLTGTMGARHSLRRDIVRWSYGATYVLARGGITAAIHCNDIREPIVRPYSGTIGDAFILMQDNVLSCTVRLSMNFLDDEAIIVMNWPVRSSDLNLIENIWDNLFRRIRQRPHHPENVQNLIDALVQELQSMPQNGIRSMPCRCQECVNYRVGHSSYW